MSRDRASDYIPEQIGPYTVVKMIGKGGAGEVFACRDEALGRLVAVKILHREASADAVRRERFVREGRMMARISSPHVVSIFGFGELDGRPYLVMEFLEGEDLESWLMRTRRPLAPAEALKYTADAARGLQAAARLDIVHRDVKPANIVVVDGQAKLTDFGLARPQDGSAMVTSEGLVTGTPAFLAPERARAVGDDVRSDIYSLGATLFTLVVGQPPYVRDTPIDVITAHLREPVPSVKARRPSVTDALDGFVSRMMAKDPRERFSNYQQLLGELETVLAHEVVGIAPQATQKSPASPFDAFADSEAAQVGLPTGVMGSLKRMGLIEIVQMLEYGKKTARLDVMPMGGAPRGQVHIKTGQVLYAEMGKLFGEPAFVELSQVSDGSFQIHYGQEPEDINISQPTQFLLLEALRQVDERSRAMESAPGLLSDESAGFVDLRPADSRIPVSADDLDPASGLFDSDPSLSQSLSDEDIIDNDPTLASPIVRPALDVRTDRTHEEGDADLDRTLIAPPQTPVEAPFEEAPFDQPPYEDAPFGTEATVADQAARPAWDEATDNFDEAATDPAAAAANVPAPVTIPAPRPQMRPTAADDEDPFERGDTLITAGPHFQDPRQGPSHNTRDTRLHQMPSSALGQAADAALYDLPLRALEGSLRVYDAIRHSATARHTLETFPFLRRVEDVLARGLRPMLEFCRSVPVVLWVVPASFLILFVVVVAVLALPPAPAAGPSVSPDNAAAVLEDVDAIPAPDRAGADWLRRGHALQALGDVDEAVDAYRAALGKGEVDDRALGVVIERINQKDVGLEVEMLTRWPGDAVSARLAQKVKHGEYHERINAYAALKARGEDDPVDVAGYALKNLAEGPTCLDRKIALEQLRDVGAKSDKVGKAVRAAQKRGDNECMDRLFRDMLPDRYAR